MVTRLKSRTGILLIVTFFLATMLCLDRLVGIRKIISFLLREKEEVAVVKCFSFSASDALGEWDDKILHKKVTYKIESSENESYVHAISERSCSAMYYKMKLDACQRPILSWKWRVARFPDKKSPDDLLSEEEDDFAARVYVVFPALFFSHTKVLEYIWAEDLDVGTVSSSPYSDNIKLIVAESGAKEGGEWVLEERDIYEDYLSAFNAKPKLKIGAIAFMCDSDSTKSNAEAYFDEIKLFLKEQEGGDSDEKVLLNTK